MDTPYSANTALHRDIFLFGVVSKKVKMGSASLDMPCESVKITVCGQAGIDPRSWIEGGANVLVKVGWETR